MTSEPKIPQTVAADSVIKVAVIEDHHKFRECLEFLLNSTEGYRCVGSFRTMEEALEKIGYALPDFILLDIGLPGMSGIEGLKILKERYPEVLVMMNTVFDDDDRIFDALAQELAGIC